MRFLLPLVVVVVPFIAAPAFAQVPAGEPITQGVYNPTIGIAGDGDASAVDKNPALLGSLRSWSGVYFHTERDPNKRVGGRGDAFFFASPLPFIRAVMIGFGVQSLRPPAIFPYGDQVKLSLAMAWRVAPSVTFGWSVATLYSVQGLGDLTTLDLSLAFRINRFVAAGLVVRDVNNPKFGTLPLQRVYEPEIAIRPLGCNCLELAAAMRVGERRGDLDPRFRLWVKPLKGLAFKADVEWRRDVDLDGIHENDVRVALGVQFDLDHIGIAGFGLFGRDSDQVRGHGFTLAARFSGERYDTFWAGPKVLYRYDINDKTKGRVLEHLVLRLASLERERSVAGIVLNIGDTKFGWAQAEELRAAITRLREKGKHVFAYIAETDSMGYYVASTAEKIFADPAGGIRLQGLSSTSLFFKGTGDLIGVKADFVKIAEYKSGPERFTRTEASPEAKEQRTQYQRDVFWHLQNGIAQSRNVAAEKTRAFIDGGPYTSQGAKDIGLVDEMATPENIERHLQTAMGGRVMLRNPDRSPEHPESWSRPRIAILHIDGDIVDGKSQSIPWLGVHVSGAQTIIPTIAALRQDPRIRGVVVRINSPGGSALASDLIARELEQTAKVKPVVCSLSDVAASGGYFVAAPCQKIFASPSTLTGSIGIYTGKFDISGLAAKVGITHETYTEGKSAGINSMWRMYTDEERKLILDRLTYYYRRFVDAVARGRKRSFDEVDRVARGHIWSGNAAIGHGLVDAFGGITDALTEVKRRASLRVDAKTDLVDLPRVPGLLTQVAQLFGIEMKEKDAEPSLLPPPLVDALRHVPASLVLGPSTPQARLDVGIDIE